MKIAPRPAASDAANVTQKVTARTLARSRNPVTVINLKHYLQQKSADFIRMYRNDLTCAENEVNKKKGKIS